MGIPEAGRCAMLRRCLPTSLAVGLFMLAGVGCTSIAVDRGHVPHAGAGIALAPVSPLAGAQPAGRPVGPAIIALTADPARPAIGGQVTVSWQATGESAELCRLMVTSLTDCTPQPLVGRETFTIDGSWLNNQGVVLVVTQGNQRVTQLAAIQPACPSSDRWFFVDGADLRCPEAPPLVSPAVAQPFAHGQMIRLDKTDTYYVFLPPDPNDNNWQKVQVFTQIEAQRKPGAAAVDPAAMPPSGCAAPAGGFGQLWRGAIDLPGADSLRAQLGCPAGPAQDYTAKYQCEAAVGAFFSCFLLGPDGHVLHMAPDSSLLMRTIWDARSATLLDPEP